jgi:hypothetical protein
MENLYLTDVEEVKFYVYCKRQITNLTSINRFVQIVSGKSTVTLILFAFTNQITASNLTDIKLIQKRGEKYLKQARHLAEKQGFIVTNSEFGGIIHPSNLEWLIESPNLIVWEFPQRIE